MKSEEIKKIYIPIKNFFFFFLSIIKLIIRREKIVIAYA